MTFRFVRIGAIDCLRELAGTPEPGVLGVRVALPVKVLASREHVAVAAGASELFVARDRLNAEQRPEHSARSQRSAAAREPAIRCRPSGVGVTHDPVRRAPCPCPCPFGPDGACISCLARSAHQARTGSSGVRCEREGPNRRVRISNSTSRGGA